MHDEFCSRLRHEISRFVQRLEREYNEATIDYRDYTVYTGTAGRLTLASTCDVVISQFGQFVAEYYYIFIACSMQNIL